MDIVVVGRPKKLFSRYMYLSGCVAAKAVRRKPTSNAFRYSGDHDSLLPRIHIADPDSKA